MKRKRTIVKYNSGLTLIHKFNNRQKAVYFEFRFKGGLWNDPEGKLGLSHFLEHTLSFSNSEYTKKEKDDFLKKLFYRNFTTSGEYINAYAYMSDEEFEEAFKNHCNYLSSYNIPNEEFENERKVIQQEIKRHRIDLADEMYYLIRSSRYKKLEKFKYIRPAGTVEDVENITKADVEEYWKKIFALNNCQLTVYGAVSLDKTKKLVKKYVLPNFVKRSNKSFVNYYNLSDKLTKPNMYVTASPDGARSKVRVENIWVSDNASRINYHLASLLDYIYTGVGREFFRNKYGLTYSARLSFRVNEHPLNKQLNIYAITELDCDESNVKKALEVLPEFYGYLQNYLIDDDIIKEAHTSFRRYSKAAPVKDYVKIGSSEASRYFDLGYFYTKKQNRQYRRESKKVKADQLKEWRRQLFSTKPYIYVVSNTKDELPKYTDLCKQIKKNTKWMAEI